jgi:PAS domain S-box-containing protein
MEFLQYENAVARYHKTLNIKSLPLVSWNFYAENFNKINLSFADTVLLTKLSEKNSWKTTWNFQDHLQNDTVIVVTDAKLQIVFASNNIKQMNGYKPNEVIGNSPKMFQGKLTDAVISKQISMAVKAQKPFKHTIINYCKDGTIYKCNIKGFPVFNIKGELTNFIALEKIAA